MVEAGVATGAHDAGLSRPVAGDHAHDTPPEPDSGADPPAQMVALPDAAATGGWTTVTVALAGFVDEQPAALVTTSA